MTQEIFKIKQQWPKQGSLSESFFVAESMVFPAFSWKEELFALGQKNLIWT